MDKEDDKIYTENSKEIMKGCVEKYSTIMDWMVPIKSISLEEAKKRFPKNEQ